VWLSSYAQEQELRAHFIPQAIDLDGQLLEAKWTTADKTTPFWMTFPRDSVQAQSSTEVRILHDEYFLYIGATCTDQTPGNFVVQSLKRDFDFSVNDAFAIYLDAFKDGNNALGFAVNPFGVQWDAIISDGGHKKRSINTNWDGMWYAEVWQDPDKKSWSVEIAIPFNILRYDHQQKDWKINFARNDLKSNEVSTWVPVARGFETTTLSSMGTLSWEKPLKKPGLSTVINPYVAVGGVKDNSNDRPATALFNTGMDAKIAINSSLNLDLTLKPDFSQVEVDQQVIDLQRFELFFPEKRPFFLEHSDLFEKLGNSRIRPFFSRRIGSAGDDPVNILYGARLSGNLNDKWRVGLMNVQTESPQGETSHKNYTVATVQRNLFQGSSLTAFMTNRQGFDKWRPGSDYERVGGIEFDYRLFASRLTGKAFLHYAFSDASTQAAKAFTFKTRYKEKKYSIFLGMDSVEEGYFSGMDYVPRLYHLDNVQDTTIQIGYVDVRNSGYYRFFFNQHKTLDFISPSYKLDLYFDQEYHFLEYRLELDLTLKFKNSAYFNLQYSNNAPRLLVPLLLNGLELPFDVGVYHNRGYLLTYDSGQRKCFSAHTSIGYRYEYTGHHFDFTSDFVYRLNRHFNAGLNFSKQDLGGFDNQEEIIHFVLLGSKIEYSFNKNISFTTFLQYNTQKENFNINARFNWRYQPLSDFHLVYTENYLTGSFAPKNRALVMKLNYWIPL